jgi:CubicO group peptidase (beta-lactamase class C family)
MNKFKISTYVLYSFVFFSITSCSNKQKEIAKIEVFNPNYKQTLDSLVPNLLLEYLAPAMGVGIIENGKIEFINVYGEHQKGFNAPQNTIFNVASITKPVVAAAILKLVENKDWDLDEPLFHYWTDPDVKDDAYAKLLTTRHCLAHTTGFKNWRWNEDEEKLKFNFKPGTKFQYSGEGMEYLRRAVERKFDIGLEELVDSLIFAPLKMTDATLAWLEDKDTVRFAKWYDTQGNLHPTNYKSKSINAADDLLITVMDLLQFGNAVMHQKIVDDTLYKEMIQPQSAINDKLNQGLGWVVYDKLTNDEYILNHDGGDTGVVTTLILFPKSKNGIVLFVNSDNGADITNSIIKEIVSNGKEVIEALHWDNKIPETIEIRESILDKYTGTYNTDRGFSITFHKTGRNLITDSKVFPKVKLYPSTVDEFFPLPFEVYFKFFEIENEITFQLLSSEREIELTGVKE